MRTITARLTIPEEDEAGYADVIGELVLADYMADSSVGLELVSDSAPPAGTPHAPSTGSGQAVVASSMARAAAAGLVEKYAGLSRLEWRTTGNTPFVELYKAYCLLAASFDDLLAERDVPCFCCDDDCQSSCRCYRSTQTTEQLEDDLYQAMNDLRPDDAEKASK